MGMDLQKIFNQIKQEYDIDILDVESLRAAAGRLSFMGRHDYSEKLLRSIFENNHGSLYDIPLLIVNNIFLGKTGEALNLIKSHKKEFREEALKSEHFKLFFIEVIYSFGQMFLYNREPVSANILMRLLEEIDPYFTQIAKKENVLREDEFREKILNTIDKYEKGELPLPELTPSIDIDYDKILSPFQGKRVLCVGRETIYRDKTSRKSEVLPNQVLGAEIAGLIAYEFPTNELSMPYGYSIEELALEFDRLDQVVTDFKPDYMIFDQFMDIRSAEKEAYFIERIKKIRFKSNLKIIAYYLDGWSDDHLGPIKNAVIYADGIGNGDTAVKSGRKEFSSPHFTFTNHCFPETSSAATLETKDIDLAFVGQLHQYRTPWMVLIEGRKINCRTQYSGNLGTSDLSKREEYIDLFKRTKISLNFSRRIDGQFAITGRIWEAIFSYAVLMEEYSPDIEKYLIPFCHYIPVTNVEQIRVYSSYLLKDKALRERIAHCGYSHLMKHTSSKVVWSKYLLAAEGQLNNQGQIDQ
jgi:hypothetical protein